MELVEVCINEQKGVKNKKDELIDKENSMRMEMERRGGYVGSSMRGSSKNQLVLVKDPQYVLQ